MNRIDKDNLSSCLSYSLTDSFYAYCRSIIFFVTDDFGKNIKFGKYKMEGDVKIIAKKRLEYMQDLSCMNYSRHNINHNFEESIQKLLIHDEQNDRYDTYKESLNKYRGIYSYI